MTTRKAQTNLEWISFLKQQIKEIEDANWVGFKSENLGKSHNMA